jgi:hypothetical protein
MAKRQGELGFSYEAEPDGDEVTAWGGLPLVVEVMKKLGVEHHAEELLGVKKREGAASDLVDWHRQKAGTVELVHDITKNELGAGVMPSGKFGANAAWYRLTTLAHNVLVAMKRLVAPPDLKDARPKRLRFRLFTLPAKVILHARAIVARVAARLLQAADVFALRTRTMNLRFA